MNKAMKARHGGFTLVELLIVIIIIAILAGMLLLATGSATDSADATRIINDLRNLKGAAMMYYVDNNAWPADVVLGTLVYAGGTALATEPSMDLYLDRPFFGATPKVHDFDCVKYTDDTGTERVQIGYVFKTALQSGVQQKLEQKAPQAGVMEGGEKTSWKKTTAIVPGDGVYMVMK